MSDADVNIFDRRTVSWNRTRAAQGDWPAFDFLIQEVADRLVDRLYDVKRRFSLALDLGARAGAVGRMLESHPHVERLVQTDLSEAMCRRAFAVGPALVCDEEWLPFASHSFDLALSNVNLHWVNDLPGALVQIRECLKPDGLFLATMFGGQTLQELRDCLMQAEIDITGGLSPRISPFADTNDLGGLLQRAGFALPVVDSEYITVSYENMFRLLADLRGMGEGNSVFARVRRFSSKSLFYRAAELYRERYSNEEGRIYATFHVFYLHGWSPHGSQQKPAARGSAVSSLAKILTDDTSLPGKKNHEPGA